MSNRLTYQVHANVNVDHGDAALRVTITVYDETGAATSHKTWRGHQKALWVEGSDWMALEAVQGLYKLLAGQVQGAGELAAEPDVPLF
jgi:hypothetical protein